MTRSKIRIVRPTPGLRALARHSPPAEAVVREIAGKLRPAMHSLYVLRRRLATGAVAILTIWLFAHVMFGANGMVVYRQKKTEYQSLQKEINNLEKENGLYTRQIQSLKTDPKAIEKEAREQLHYARPGEVVYISPPPVQVEHPSTDAAQK